MSVWYWAAEYGKVLGGYLFLMFLWPSVVFYGHLRKKSSMYRFSFCVTVQIVLVSTVVLTAGLFHILNRTAFACVFYGVFFVCLCLNLKKYAVKFHFPKFRFPLNIRRQVKGVFWDLWWRKETKLFEYLSLAAVILFGMAYFSYGAFQIHSYGGADLYTHHAWIYGLMDGRIFADGIYPEAMHCFVYGMNALWGIRVDSILLFLQNIHIAVFFISAYFLMRQVFHWRYTPIMVLALFMTLDVVSADEIYGMYRLQLSLPQEFGLHTQFLSALYLIRYLNSAGQITRKGKNSKYCWDSNLFLFMMSWSASAATHYYTTIMAVIVSAAFAVFAVRKILNKKYLIPVLSSMACGILIAALPMAGAYGSGIPFNYSITWALNVMDGSETRELDEKLESEEERIETDETEKGQADYYPIEKNGFELPRILSEKMEVIYEKGYAALYGQRRANWVLGITVALTVCCFLGCIKPGGLINKICRGYPPFILLSFLYMLLYSAPFIGLPELISDSRFCSTGHMLILAVLVIPADMLLAKAACFWENKVMFHFLSALAPVGIYAAVYLTGNFHGYLFYELTRYNEAVETTNSITESFPKGSFVVVAPTDELYPVIPYGWHEELLSFVKNIREETYSLSSEHIFIYVEKKPFQYSQTHFFRGPLWLGQEKYSDVYWKKYSKKYPEKGISQEPEINTLEISDDAAQVPVEKIDAGWQTYTNLDKRTVLESKAYDWCRKFSEKNPRALKVYYEDENFVCYYLNQKPGEQPYGLGIE